MRCIHRASATLTSINGKIVPKAREGVAALPYAEVCDPAIHNQTFKPNDTMHPPGKRSNNINVQPIGIDTRGRTRRSAPTRRICSMICIIKFGKEIFITSGEIGTNAMHPTRKRNIDIN